MSWYGSIQNRLSERALSPTPVVGMGVTECLWSDRHPYEIIEVKDDRHITIRSLNAKRIDHNGFSECQEYEYSSNPNGAIYHLFKNKKGRWVRRVGTRGVDNSSGWAIGVAEEYYDPTF